MTNQTETNFDKLVLAVVRWESDTSKGRVASILLMGRRNRTSFTEKVGRSLVKLEKNGMLDKVVRSELVYVDRSWQRGKHMPRKVAYYSVSNGGN